MGDENKYIKRFAILNILCSSKSRRIFFIVSDVSSLTKHIHLIYLYPFHCCVILSVPSDYNSELPNSMHIIGVKFYYYKVREKKVYVFNQFLFVNSGDFYII